MTRRDDVDTDGILRDLDRELPRKGEDRTFGGGVSGNPVATDQRRYRGHVDDRSPAGRSQDGQGFAADQERAGRMNREHPVPVGTSQIGQPSEARMAGGIEYASKDAKPCHRFGNRRLEAIDRKSTRLNSRSLMRISYAVFCL